MVGSFDYEVVLRSLPFLARGMGLSLLLTALATIGGIVLGALLAALRLNSNKLISFPAGFYVNFFRSIPLILVIFWFYFMVPLIIGRPVGAFYSALIAFTAFEAAYFCEIIRGGIMSVPKGQTYAGQAIGFTAFQTMIHVVLPQAIRNMTPVLVTRIIIMFQDTSLVYVIGLRDFLTSADIVATTENRIVEMYLFAAAAYFLICLTGSLGAQTLRRRLAQ